MPRKLSPQEALDRAKKSGPDALLQISTRIPKNLWESLATQALQSGMDDMSSAYKRALETWASNLQGVTGLPMDQIEDDDLKREVKRRGYLVLTEKEFERIINRQLKDLRKAVQDSLTAPLSAKSLSQMVTEAREEIE